MATTDNLEPDGVTFTGADIPKLYYECDPCGDDAALLAIIGRWLDSRGTETVLSLAAFIARETMGADMSPPADQIPDAGDALAAELTAAGWPAVSIERDHAGAVRHVWATDRDGARHRFDPEGDAWIRWPTGREIQP